MKQAKEPTLPGLLYQYLSLRQEERTGWTTKGQLKGSVSDFNRVEAAIAFLKAREIATVESLDRHLDGISEKAVSIRGGMKKAEKRIRAINTMLAYIDKYEKYKPVHAEYAAIGWKKKKEKFAEGHWEELDTYNAAARYFKANLKGNSYSRKDLESERQQLAAALPGQQKELDEHGFDITNLESNGKYLIEIELPPGTIIIRYGKESGNYTAPEGTDYEKLAMPYVKETVPYYKYKVISKNLLVTCVVEKGKVAPGFDSDGGAIQYYHHLTIFQSVREGILERL